MVMTELAEDLREEGNELHTLLMSLSNDDWKRSTPFKAWTVEAVIQHLLAGDWMNTLSLTNPDRFEKTLKLRNAARAKGDNVSGLEFMDEDPGSAGQLCATWYQQQQKLCELYSTHDPKTRMKWVGPDMSVRSGATARLMETWAHGQDIYDLLKKSRTATDRIRNIATLGVNTFRWTFENRDQTPPGAIPYVRLVAPSDAIWTWNEPSEENFVEGLAIDFCHVVTQGRNIADVNLEVVGDTANKWMSIAQCFAGKPEDPPAPGHRVW